ncbi:amidohydrolase family protein [Nitrosospira sp. Is2]|uniref:amidohydrolase family protein n=1 Tax=Nitrosospira sp. Is2 TaxID=3080532 RepID=UPI00295371A9|nr:amidohydrolase family protein [Nitrosospira sp. Is2]WON74111.1 amidohydrolase family protein [Nitrosospira sp. Is2]
MLKHIPCKSVTQTLFCLYLILSFVASAPVAAKEPPDAPILLHAARVFDGSNMRANTSVLVINGKVAEINTRNSFKSNPARTIDLGDATILPGFIELHAHLAFQNIPAITVLKHGITTLRDMGGPVHMPYGGDGSLRVLTSGPIITAPGGYPIPMMGEKNIARAVSTEKEARDTVRDLINGGAVVIKIALEPGGEQGAPWSSSHGHSHGAAHNHHSGHSHHDISDAQQTHIHDKPARDASQSKKTWPLLPENIVKAIVDEAHKNNRKVTAHIAEEQGAQIAINAGIDEWAHVPCDIIPETLLKKAVEQNVKIVTTLDTLSKCSGIAANASTWAALGGEFLYGAEVAHPDIPWGIDVQELIYMRQMARMDLTDILRAATSKAGEHLNFPLLGTLQQGAPADIIAVKGNPAHNLKILEYPDLVLSGGKIIVNNFD